MGVKYTYCCDKCFRLNVKDITPFEPSDAGERTPMGWCWKEDGTLYCPQCLKGTL